jgi:putative ABC transport system ATP-binding protein
MKQPILKVEDVKKIYRVGDSNIEALKGVSLEINKGDYTAIIGKSGSGKSTLMHIIGLLDTPSEGKVILNGDDVSTLNEAKLARIRNKEIGFVFQAFNLLQRTSALDNVMLPLKYSDIPKHKWEHLAKEKLHMVDLTERMLNKSNELSGGQKQRVAIARALVNDPSIILADEPTGNLDTKTGNEIIKLFERLHEQGKTIILVTHDDDLAAKAKKQIVIKDGLIVKS